jgi:hypothetical protein
MTWLSVRGEAGLAVPASSRFPPHQSAPALSASRLVLTARAHERVS